MPDKFTFSAGTTLPEIAESVAPEIGFLTRTVSPLLAWLGFPDRLGNTTNAIHEWLEEALLANSTLVNGAQDNSETTIEVTAGTGTRFIAGDIVQVDGSRELMSVTTPNANDLVVVRAIRGTVGAAILDGATIERIANPAVENETAPSARPVNRVRQSNFTEIFRRIASVTRSERLVQQLGGIDDELDHQVILSEMDLIRDLAATVVNGKQQSANPEGTTTTARTMDGIIQSILAGSDPVSVDASAAAVDETLINQVLRDMFSRGANPDAMAMHPVQRRKVSALVEGRTRFVTEDGTLGNIVDIFQSDFGSLRILEADIFIPIDAILFLDSARVRLVKLGEGADPFDRTPIAKTGLTDRIEVVGEFTLELKNAVDGGHGLLSNLDIT